MAGNSRRRGAIRKAGTKKGPTVGSGGQRRRALEGRGPTPPAHLRPNHPAAKRAQSPPRRPAKRPTDETETVLGRNPVLECLRAGVPATALYVALGTDADERVTESVARAADSGISILEVPRADLDRMTSNHLHQGIALQVPPYNYAHPDDLLATALGSPPPLLVALDNISDPRNLGAIVRSVAAFGGHGVLIPQRRSASVTAVAWRTSAGAAARIPVARATNLTRTLKDWADRGIRVIGLDAGGDTVADDLDGADPLVVVVGSEGKGLSRLVRQNCDEVVSIPMAGPTESLNASVAAGVVLAEIARQRRARPRCAAGPRASVRCWPSSVSWRRPRRPPRRRGSTCRPIAAGAGRPPRSRCVRSRNRSNWVSARWSSTSTSRGTGNRWCGTIRRSTPTSVTTPAPRSPGIRSTPTSESWCTSSPCRRSARSTADAGWPSFPTPKWCAATR
jgi:23S rRNA (guanosine2251-2'-O)-methyltransferase